MHIGLCSPDWPPTSAAKGIVSYVSAVRKYFLSQGLQVSVISQGCLHGGDDREFSLGSANEAGGPFDALSRRVGRLFDRIAGIGLLRCRHSFSVEAVGSLLLDCYSATLREGTR